MKKGKEEIKINGKKFYKYYDPISDCYMIESPRTKKVGGIAPILISGGKVPNYKDCPCCGEPMYDGETYVKPLPEKQMKVILEQMARELERTEK